jgi:hypothetical protein
MSRVRLPNRRQNATETVTIRGHLAHVTVGFARTGEPLEVFARCARPGSDLDALLDDSAVLISRGLQHGDNLTSMLAGLGREHETTPLSIVAALVEVARRIAHEECGG